MRNYLYIPALALVLTLNACDSSSSSSAPAPQVTTTQPTTAQPSQPSPENPTPIDPTNPATGESSVLGLRAGLVLPRAQYLQNVGNGIAKSAEDFLKASDALNQATLAYCGSYDPALLETAKLRFSDAMLLWQQIELFQMGPLSENSAALKYKIYGWPQISNYCKIDEESMLALSDAEYSLPSNTNRKGLQALEYLLYDASLTSICPASNETKGLWEAQTPAKKWEARCAFMKPVAAELVTNATTLSTQWGSKDNNYITSKIGNQDAEQSALQEIFNNLFYIDLEVKNQKLAAVAGSDIKLCPKSPAPCPDKEELRFSHLSKQAMTSNVRSIADLIFGFGEPRSGGLSALLRNDNGSGIAATTEANVTKLVTLTETEQSSLETVLAAKNGEDCDASQNSWVCKVRQTIKDVVGDFKGEYTSILKTAVPLAPQGDND
ncbi:MAG: hypothetical protein EOP10_26600, partial [Proteobacteria bacterium]